MNVSPNSLPNELAGTVHPQWVKCGYEGCKCASGELHGPFYYRFFWAEGKIQKSYVRLPDLEATRSAYRRRQERERTDRLQRDADLQHMRDFKALVRDLERHISDWRHA